MDYRLSPVMEAGALTGLAVEVRLRGDADGSTELELPDRWAAATDLWKGVRDLRVEGAGAVEEPGPALRVVRARPNAPLVVRYRVSGGAGDLNIDDPSEVQPFKVHLTRDWVYASGEAVFVHPKGGEDRPARFTWTGAPAGWTFASDLEHLTGADGRRGARPGVVGDVEESVILAGRDVTVFTLTRSGEPPVRVAARGRYAFGAEAFAALLGATLTEERAFWRDEGTPFLVTLGPVRTSAAGVSLGGTGRTDGFMLALSSGAAIEQLRALLEHEYFHTWNSRQLGGLENGEREPLGYWFSEGFTDFYTWRLLVRSGRSTPAEWAAAWNEMLLAYATSPRRTEGDVQALKTFWTDPTSEKLPYQRGAMLAAIWDARLRAASGGRTSLDDVMHAQRVAARRVRPVSAALLFPDVAARMGLDVRPDLARHVDGGEAITLPADVFGPCATVETETRPVFQRGWAVSDPDRRFKDVVEGSAAWRAGLRNGMTFVAREAGRPGDSTQDYMLRVKEGEAEHTIRYRPAGVGSVPVQQVRLAPGADAASCARSLSGLPALGT